MTTAGIGKAFQRLAVIAALLGMAFGAYIGATKRLHLGPVHAHLLLIGWLGFFVIGHYYRGIGSRYARPALGHLVLTVFGLAVMIPALWMLLDGDAAAEPVLALASLVILVGQAVFAGIVFVETARSRAA